jgi:plastocyanin
MEENTTQSRGSNNLLIILVVVALVAVGGYMFMRGRGTTPSTNQVETTNGTTQTSMTVAQSLTVEASEFAFSAVPTWQAGQPVSLTLTNTGKMPHDFVIDEIAGARTEIIQPGETTTIEFTPTAAGTFTYYCSVGNHRAQGMEGTVTVQ